MKFCPKCKSNFEDHFTFCNVCGTALSEGNVPPPPPVENLGPEAYGQTKKLLGYDHTAEYDAEDIRNNKLYAMLIYLMGAVGIIIAKLCAGDSLYIGFHVRQYVKILVAQLICACVAAVTCWLILPMIAYMVVSVVLVVIRAICLIAVIDNKVEDAPIIRSIPFFN